MDNPNGHASCFNRRGRTNCTITYDFNGGSPIAGKEYVSKYIEIDIVKLEGAELQGKKFLGWYNATDEGETIITEIKYSTGDLTLKAKWEDATP